MNKSRLINISRKYKCFSWTNQRTGSTHFTDVLKKLQFESADLDLETMQLSNFNPIALHNHTCFFFENHWNYEFIVSMRNPYSMMISQVGLSPLKSISYNKEIVKVRVENIIQNPFRGDGCCNCFHERVPDYAIRLEHLYEDWIKIPFVANHELNLSGELKNLCQIKINNSPNSTKIDYWKQYYDQSLADSVYYSQPETFDLFGYDRDSWK